MMPDFQTAHASYIDIKIKRAMIEKVFKSGTKTAAIPG